MFDSFQVRFSRLKLLTSTSIQPYAREIDDPILMFHWIMRMNDGVLFLYIFRVGLRTKILAIEYRPTRSVIRISLLNWSMHLYGRIDIILSQRFSRFSHSVFCGRIVWWWSAHTVKRCFHGSACPQSVFRKKCFHGSAMCCAFSFFTDELLYR